jgi:murein DD-endopeptidase MepM/ murein hydrolase activator NlpD
VVTTSREKPGYGVTVEINHGNGYATRYAHARVAKVKTGDRVEKGDVVAIVGSTGRSTGTHLHFEVMRDGETVNPRKYLRASL